MISEPSTPLGRLIRYYRERLGLSQPEMAERLGWKPGKYIQMELGRGIARRGNPAPEHRASDVDAVAVAVELGITPEELEKAGRPDAAERLRGSALPVAAKPGLSGADLAAVDRMFEAFLARCVRGKTLRQTEADAARFMFRRPGDSLAARANTVADYIAELPVQAAQSDVRAV